MTEREPVAGQIEATDLGTRKPVFVRIDKIAGVLSLREGGPARLLFDAGGYLDICGDAETWRRNIAIAERKLREGA